MILESFEIIAIQKIQLIMIIDSSLKGYDEMIDVITLISHYLSIIEVSDLFRADHRINNDRRNIQIGLSLQ